MAAKGSKSKKRSAASSVAKPHENLIFFLDRNLGKQLAKLIAGKDRRIEVHDDHFAPDTADTDLLREVGKRKWVFMTKDRHIAQNQIEVVALLQSGSPAFVYTSANMTSATMADAFLKALPQIKRCLTKFDWPFIGTITASGSVRILYPQSKLIKRIQ
jgi:uncharacterized protein with PIN domain